MSFEVNEIQSSLREEVRRFLTDRAGSEALRRAVEEMDGFDPGLWTTAAGELGWCGLSVAEGNGGLGMGATGSTVLLEECGRRLACMPFWSTTCLAAPMTPAT